MESRTVKNWENDTEAFKDACYIQEELSLPIGVVPYLHEAISKYYQDTQKTNLR